MALTKENIAAVKGRGFLRNRGTECFSGRVVSPGGVYSADDLRAIAECADRFGSGRVNFTSRLSAEIPGIPFENIEPAEAFLAERGLSFGGTGAKVRPVTSCKGTVCVFGNIDTQALARELHQRFYLGMRDVQLPHKFKIGVGGCPNSCMKPSLNDIGFEGRRVFAFDSEKCRGCKKCQVEASCPSKAARVADGKCVIDGEKCLRCGACVGKCPFGAVPAEAEAACRVYVGGTWGKSTRMGTPLSALIPPEQCGDVAEKAILWYRENAFARERFAATLDRIGVAAFEEAIAGDDLLARRAEILAAPIKTK